MTRWHQQEPSGHLLTFVFPLNLSVMELEYLYRLLLAFVLAGAIGLEREFRDKSAGFRTMILIGVGSALFTILSQEMALGDSASDGTRIASSVVSGIGFLGAGVIVKDGLNIKGLTTAATIWLVAALGMGVGAGYAYLSIFVAAVTLFALLFLPPLEAKIHNLHEQRIYTIVTKKPADIDKIIHIMRQENLPIRHIHKGKTDGMPSVRIESDGHKDVQHAAIERVLDEVTGVIELR